MEIMGKWARQTGFTLIELLVISIIAILSSFVFVAFNSARAKGRDAGRTAGLSQFRTALEAFWIDGGAYPSTGGAWWARCPALGGHGVTGVDGWIPELAPIFIAELPADPKYDAAQCYGYRYRSDGLDYKVSVYRTAETLCPEAGGAWYDPAQAQALCVMSAYTNGAALW